MTRPASKILADAQPTVRVMETRWLFKTAESFEAELNNALAGHPPLAGRNRQIPAPIRIVPHTFNGVSNATNESNAQQAIQVRLTTDEAAQKQTNTSAIYKNLDILNPQDREQLVKHMLTNDSRERTAYLYSYGLSQYIENNPLQDGPNWGAENRERLNAYHSAAAQARQQINSQIDLYQRELESEASNHADRRIFDPAGYFNSICRADTDVVSMQQLHRQLSTPPPVTVDSSAKTTVGNLTLALKQHGHNVAMSSFVDGLEKMFVDFRRGNPNASIPGYQRHMGTFINSVLRETEQAQIEARVREKTFLPLTEMRALGGQAEEPSAVQRVLQARKDKQFDNSQALQAQQNLSLLDDNDHSNIAAILRVKGRIQDSFCEYLIYKACMDANGGVGEVAQCINSLEQSQDITFNRKALKAAEALFQQAEQLDKKATEVQKQATMEIRLFDLADTTYEEKKKSHQDNYQEAADVLRSLFKETPNLAAVANRIKILTNAQPETDTLVEQALFYNDALPPTTVEYDTALAELPLKEQEKATRAIETMSNELPLFDRLQQAAANPADMDKMETIDDLRHLCVPNSHPEITKEVNTCLSRVKMAHTQSMVALKQNHPAFDLYRQLHAPLKAVRDISDTRNAAITLLEEDTLDIEAQTKKINELLVELEEFEALILRRPDTASYYKSDIDTKRTELDTLSYNLTTQIRGIQGKSSSLDVIQADNNIRNFIMGLNALRAALTRMNPSSPAHRPLTIKRQDPNEVILQLDAKLTISYWVQGRNGQYEEKKLTCLIKNPQGKEIETGIEFTRAQALMILAEFRRQYPNLTIKERMIGKNTMRLTFPRTTVYQDDKQKSAKDQYLEFCKQEFIKLQKPKTETTAKVAASPPTSTGNPSAITASPATHSP